MVSLGAQANGETQLTWQQFLNQYILGNSSPGGALTKGTEFAKGCHRIPPSFPKQFSNPKIIEIICVHKEPSAIQQALNESAQACDAARDAWASPQKRSKK